MILMTVSHLAPTVFSFTNKLLIGYCVCTQFWGSGIGSLDAGFENCYRNMFKAIFLHYILHSAGCLNNKSASQLEHTISMSDEWGEPVRNAVFDLTPHLKMFAHTADYD